MIPLEANASITEKPCSKCKKVKSLDEFGFHKKGLARRQAACQQCENERSREYQKTHPEIVKARKKRQSKRFSERRKHDPVYRAHRNRHGRKYTLKKYDLTPEDYAVMLEAQGGVCAICGKAETVSNRYGLLPLAVDHNHVTDKVRGLLCHDCNRKLAFLEDATLVMLPQVYLERYC